MKESLFISTLGAECGGAAVRRLGISLREGFAARVEPLEDTGEQAVVLNFGLISADIRFPGLRRKSLSQSFPTETSNDIFRRSNDPASRSNDGVRGSNGGTQASSDSRQPSSHPGYPSNGSGWVSTGPASPSTSSAHCSTHPTPSSTHNPPRSSDPTPPSTH